MSVKPAKVQFNGGELSPWLRGRTDIAQFDKTAKLCRNFIPLTEGSLKRRGGTRFVAMTPEDVSYLFKIEAVPAEAKVMINHIEQSEVWVSRGDNVYYEVSAEGYATISGRATVLKATTLRVFLTALDAQYSFNIVATPNDAVVKINDFERSSYMGVKDEVVNYVVYKTGYQLVSGSVVLDENKTMYVTLAEEEQESGDATYGAWGTLQAFIACTVYGRIDVSKKCFMLKFSNGYLPILFDASKTAPDDGDLDEGMFVTDNTSGYDALAYTKDKVNRLAVIRRQDPAIYYYDSLGTTLAAFDYASMMFMGWPIDEDGNYAATFKKYDGVVSGKTVKVYYNGQLVWSMKGRRNG